MFSNTMKTTFLLGLMTVLIILIGRALGGQQGMVLAFFLAGVMNLGSYWFSDKIVLAMYRAQEISPSGASGDPPDGFGTGAAGRDPQAEGLYH